MPVTPSLRRAARRLRRAPAFAASALLTLTLGIGGTSAVFLVVHGVLLNPLPYPRADRLVDLSHTLAIAGIARVDQSDATYLVYRHDNRVFRDVGAYRSTAVNLRAASGAGAGAAGLAERVPAALATASVFRVLQVRPERGRPLDRDDDRPGAVPVAVIAHALWASRFGSDPAIIGRLITVDGVERRIVGVMPKGIDFPSAATALWLPLQLDPTHIRSAAFDYRGIARLRDGVSPAEAAADLQRLLPTVPEVYPGRLTASAIAATDMRAVVRPLRDVIVGDASRALWIVLGAACVLLVLACANVTNLFLARAEGRLRELAVRRALGAGGASLLGEFLSEAALLSSAGGALGLAGAGIGIRVLRSSGLGTSIPRLAEVRVDGAVIAATAAVAACAALAVSAIPVMRRGPSLAAMLVSGGRGSAGAKERSRMRRALVIAQVALALVLLAGAGLLARSFARLHDVNPGFTAAHALAFRLSLPEASYPTAGGVTEAVSATLRALRALPGVQAVGVSSKLPLDPAGREDSAVYVEDHPVPMGKFPGVYQIVFVTPGYFRAMGIPLLAGRGLRALDPGADPAHAPREVLVSQAFAEAYWHGRSPIGRHVRMDPGDPWSTVVGVVGSVRDEGLVTAPTPAVYGPLETASVSGAPYAPRDVAFVVRSAGDPGALASSVRRAVQRGVPALPMYRTIPLRELLSASMARTTFTMLLLGLAAAVAVVIGAMGIYGVIAYLVSLRTREMGVRLALGAPAASVRGLVVRQAVRDTAIGVAAGLCGALVLTRALTAVLYGVSPTDPAVLGGAAVLMLAVAVAASWLPARRAAAVDPAVALRDE